MTLFIYFDVFGYTGVTLKYDIDLILQLKNDDSFYSTDRWREDLIYEATIITPCVLIVEGILGKIKINWRQFILNIIFTAIYFAVTFLYQNINELGLPVYVNHLNWDCSANYIYETVHR